MVPVVVPICRAIGVGWVVTLFMMPTGRFAVVLEYICGVPLPTDAQDHSGCNAKPDHEVGGQTDGAEMSQDTRHVDDCETV